MEETRFSRRACFRVTAAGGLGAMLIAGDVDALITAIEPKAYTHEQGLAKRRLKVDEIFHPSTLDLIEA